MKTYEKIYKNWTGRFTVTVNNQVVDPTQVVVKINDQNYLINPETKLLMPEYVAKREATPISRVVPYPDKREYDSLKFLLGEVAGFHKTRHRGKIATKELLVWQLIQYFKNHGVDLLYELERAKAWYSEMNWAVRTHWIKKTDLPGYLRPAQVRDLTPLQLISTRADWRAMCRDFLLGRYKLSIIDWAP